MYEWSNTFFLIIVFNFPTKIPAAVNNAKHNDNMFYDIYNNVSFVSIND